MNKEGEEKSVIKSITKFEVKLKNAKRAALVVSRRLFEVLLVIFMHILFKLCCTEK